MCGINGILSKEIVKNGKERIEKMNKSLKHRGPNADGVAEIVQGQYFFGHTRLSVIDIDDRSDQPMKSYTGRSLLVYNGEIYNYKELRRFLDYPFRTRSDTEVLLAGLEQDDQKFLSKCNGMFSFAFYDNRTGAVMLGRDRMGIKPLYYYKDEKFFIFSSEIKGILSSGLIKAEFYEEAVDEYLGNRYVREPYTFFKNIFQVPAGCCLILDRGFQLNTIRYWDLPSEFNMSESFMEDEIFEKFKLCLERAIRYRMISDVPLGTYLSGGIDSSIITAVCAQNMRRSVNTYTIGFPELNEFIWAGMVADRYHTRHHEIMIEDADYFKKMEELIAYRDSPLGIPNEIPLAIMSKKLKKDITVVLSGEGADELMGGYGRIFRTPFDYKNIDSDCRKSYYDYFINQYEYVPRYMRDKYIITPYSIREKMDQKIKTEFEGTSNEANVFRFFHKYHVKGLLQRVDMMTMYASVEARVPFLDHELVELVYREVPYALKLKWKSAESMEKAQKLHSSEYSELLDEPKYLLRRMGMELLPNQLVSRRKMGFPVPLNGWMSNLERAVGDRLAGEPWFNHGLISQLADDCRKNDKAGQILWMLVNIAMFRDICIKKEWRY